MPAPVPTSPAAAVSPDAVHEAPRRPHWGWWVALGVVSVGYASIAAEQALHFKDSPIDGPFPLFNALRRLPAGHRFRHTFQLFNGPHTPSPPLIPPSPFSRTYRPAQH